MKQFSISIKETEEHFSNYYIPVSFYDNSTKEKIHKHLTDINDVITEEDIRKIDTSITLKLNQVSPSF